MAARHDGPASGGGPAARSLLAARFRRCHPNLAGITGRDLECSARRSVAAHALSPLQSLLAVTVAALREPGDERRRLFANAGESYWRLLRLTLFGRGVAHRRRSARRWLGSRWRSRPVRETQRLERSRRARTSGRHRGLHRGLVVDGGRCRRDCHPARQSARCVCRLGDRAPDRTANASVHADLCGRASRSS